MEYRRLGRSGLKVSALSIGSWVTYGKQVDDARAKACILTAIDHGVNFIDNAEAYAAGQAEVVVGRIISELRREDLVISSKVFWGGNGPNDIGLNRKHVVEACHAALKRLQIDYLDLYFCHRPDPETPIEETCETMDILIRQGKILYWGTSEWSATQLQEAYDVCDRRGLIRPTMEQPQHNLLHRHRVEVELLPLYTKYGLGTTVWSPLASGILTGKYNDGVPTDSRMALSSMQWLQEELTDDRLRVARQLTDYASQLGVTAAQLALAWSLRCPHISTVITGASRPEQVGENIKALAIAKSLDSEILERINRLNPLH